MTTRSTFIIRATAFLILTLALLSIPSGLSAQVARCVCDHYTVINHSTTGCKITVCWAVSPVSNEECETIAPGDSLRIPCPVYAVSIQICDGVFYPIIDNYQFIVLCTQGLSAPGCCIRACRGVDDEGCPTIVIEPWHCAGASC